MADGIVLLSNMEYLEVHMIYQRCYLSDVKDSTVQRYVPTINKKLYNAVKDSKKGFD